MILIKNCICKGGCHLGDGAERFCEGCPGICLPDPRGESDGCSALISAVLILTNPNQFSGAGKEEIRVCWDGEYSTLNNQVSYFKYLLFVFAGFFWAALFCSFVYSWEFVCWEDCSWAAHSSHSHFALSRPVWLWTRLSWGLTLAVTARGDVVQVLPFFYRSASWLKVKGQKCNIWIAPIKARLKIRPKMLYRKLKV